MDWFNIIAALAFQSYMMMQRRKEARQLTTEAEGKVLESEAKSTERVEEQKETRASVTEKEAQEKKEETPIIIGLPEEEPQPAASN